MWKTYLLAAFIAFSGCSVSDTRTVGLNNIEEIRNTSELPGIREVLLNADGSATLFDLLHQGRGHGLMMFDNDRKRSEQSTLKPGESCLLADGHHGSITYTFLRSEGGKLYFEVTDTFSATSFGGAVQTDTATVAIGEFKKQDEMP